MSTEAVSILIPAVVAVVYSLAGLSGSFAIFHYHRQSEYLSRLADAYSELFQQHKELIEARRFGKDCRAISTTLKVVVYKVKLVDRDEWRVSQLKIFEDMANKTGLLNGKTTAIQSVIDDEQNTVESSTDLRELLIESLRGDIIHRRPFKDWPCI